MFVQKKYPEVTYTLHIDLTQEEVRKILREADSLYSHLYHTRSTGRYPALYQFLGAITLEAGRTPYREC